MSCVTFHIEVCTCARAHPISVSQKLLDRSRSNLLRIWRAHSLRAYHILWMRCVFARVHVQLQTRSPYLRNGCTDCADIWFAVSGAYSHKLGRFLLPIQGITARARRICTCTPMLVTLERFHSIRGFTAGREPPISWVGFSVRF